MKNPLVLLVTSALIAGVVFINSMFSPTGTFIGFFSAVVVVVSFLLLFFKERVFLFWIKYTGIFLILSFIIILFFPDISGGFVGFDKEIIAILLSGLFLILSVGVIIWKAISLRKKKLK